VGVSVGVGVFLGKGKESEWVWVKGATKLLKIIIRTNNNSYFITFKGS
jgi:hypothetical protein